MKRPSKIDFIIDLLENKKLDIENKEKIFFLTANEIKKFEGPPANNLILSEIKKLKEAVNKLSPKSENKKRKNPSSNRYALTHEPIHTQTVLKYFKYKNPTGFKELVHKPTNIEEFNLKDYQDLLGQVDNSIDKIYNIPTDMYKNIKELILLMKNEGELCFQKTNSHPYLNKACEKIDEEKLKTKYSNISNGGKLVGSITTLIQNFKRNYRFDKEKTEASILRELIENIFYFDKKHYEDIQTGSFFSFKETSKENEINLSLAFDPATFDDLACFFTWVPQLKKALHKISDDILKHGNSNGTRDFKSNEKIVKFHIDRIFDDILGLTKIPLTILDERSVCNKKPEQLLVEMNDMVDYFNGICDWIIEFDYNDVDSFSIQMLPEINQPIKKLENKVNGFKHILTFYDV